MTHVVTLGVGESIQIGDEITVTVLDTQKGGHRTRLKIDQKPRFEVRRLAGAATDTSEADLREQPVSPLGR